MVDKFRIGTVVTLHGVRGGLKVLPLAEDIRDYKDLGRCLIERNGEYTQYDISEIKFLNKAAVFHLKDIDDPDKARGLIGRDIYVMREDMKPLPEGKYYVADALGSEVYTEDGELLGTFTDYIETGAHDVYVVKDDAGNEILIPCVDEFVRNVSIEEKRMTVRLIPGMR